MLISTAPRSIAPRNALGTTYMASKRAHASGGRAADEAPNAQPHRAEDGRVAAARRRSNPSNSVGTGVAGSAAEARRLDAPAIAAASNAQVIHNVIQSESRLSSLDSGQQTKHAEFQPPMNHQQQPNAGPVPNAIAGSFAALDPAFPSLPLDSLESLVPYLCVRMQVRAVPITL